MSAQQSRRRARRRCIWTPVVVVAAALAVVVVDRPAMSGATGGAPRSRHEVAGGTWQRLPPLPASVASGFWNPVLISAGADVILVSTEWDVGQGPHVVLASYSPKLDRWALGAPSPLTGQYGGAALAWTGHELIVAPGGGGGTGVPTLGAAYAPSTDTWRTISSPVASSASTPWDGRAAVVGEPAIWDGNEVLFPNGGLAYSPDRDSWRDLPPSPIGTPWWGSAVWTGNWGRAGSTNEMLVWGGCRSDEPCSDDEVRAGTVTSGFAYDPERNAWRELPVAPITPRVRVQSVWTGSELFIWGGRTSTTVRTSGALYRPERAAWEVVPPGRLAPRSDFVLAAIDDAVVVATGVSEDGFLLGDAFLYRVADRQWLPMPHLPLSKRQRAASVVHHGSLYVWGGLGPCSSSPCPPESDGARYTADRAGPTDR